MKVNLSKRMKLIADMVTPGRVVADIGCDHALISIYLVEQGISSKIYALDKVEGPLKSAEKNIRSHGLESKITLSISDGFDAVSEGETDAAVIAGMGGYLIIDILTRGLHKMNDGYELVLSPQSDIYEVRRFLSDNGFSIIDEEMLKEDGKYYNIIKAVKSSGVIDDEVESISATDRRIYDTYGKRLVEKKSPVLAEYIENRIEKLAGICCRLSKTGDASDIPDRHIIDRIYELNKEIRELGRVRDLLK